MKKFLRLISLICILAVLAGCSLVEKVEEEKTATTGENANNSLSLRQRKRHPTGGAFLLILIFILEGFEPSKCNADERCRRRLDGGEP